MQRSLSLCTALAVVIFVPSAVAQAGGDGWQRMRALPAGKTIDVYTPHSHQRCDLVSVDDTQLSCQSGKKHSYVFSRAEIQRVRTASHGVYTIVGLVAGAGAGAGIGYAVARPASSDTCNNQPASQFNFCGLDFSGLAEGAAAGVGAVAGAIVGGTGGYFIDRSQRKVVFQAP